MAQPNNDHWYIKVAGTLYDPTGEVPVNGKIRVLAASTSAAAAKSMCKILPVGKEGQYEFYLASGIFELEVMSVNVYENLGYVQFTVGDGNGSEDFTQGHEITLEDLLLERSVSGVTLSTLPVLQGISGADGRDGADGAPGIDGLNSVDGRDGIDGIDGLDGNDGAVGATGAVGPEGPQGAQGIQGPAGIDGTNGTNGLDGNDGATGLTGLTGAQGIQGVAGDTGPQGIQGIAGAAANQGIQGIQGETGATGPQGIQGDAGVDGLDGAAANQGIQGIQGIAGNDGADGADGDTIYREYSYSVDNAAFHDDFTTGDIYRRERTMTNGTPSVWTIGARIIGEVGADGDTLWYDSQYSVDNANWHSTFITGDKYTRSALVTNGVYGAWATGAQIVPILGVDYDDGITVFTEYEYSIDGSTNWHSTPVVGDHYLQLRVVTNAVPGAWSSALKFIPEAGVDYSTNGIDIAALTSQAEIYRDEASAFATSAAASAALSSSALALAQDNQLIYWNGV